MSERREVTLPLFGPPLPPVSANPNLARHLQTAIVDASHAMRDVHPEGGLRHAESANSDGTLNLLDALGRRQKAVPVVNPKMRFQNIVPDGGFTVSCRHFGVDPQRPYVKTIGPHFKLPDEPAPKNLRRRGIWPYHCAQPWKQHFLTQSQLSGRWDSGGDAFDSTIIETPGAVTLLGAVIYELTFFGDPSPTQVAAVYYYTNLKIGDEEEIEDGATQARVICAVLEDPHTVVFDVRVGLAVPNAPLGVNALLTQHQTCLQVDQADGLLLLRGPAAPGPWQMIWTLDYQTGETLVVSDLGIDVEWVTLAFDWAVAAYFRHPTPLEAEEGFLPCVDPTPYNPADPLSVFRYRQNCLVRAWSKETRTGRFDPVWEFDSVAAMNFDPEQTFILGPGVASPIQPRDGFPIWIPESDDSPSFLLHWVSGGQYSTDTTLCNISNPFTDFQAILSSLGQPIITSPVTPLNAVRGLLTAILRNGDVKWQVVFDDPLTVTDDTEWITAWNTFFSANVDDYAGLLEEGTELDTLVSIEVDFSIRTLEPGTSSLARMDEQLAPILLPLPSVQYDVQHPPGFDDPIRFPTDNGSGIFVSEVGALGQATGGGNDGNSYLALMLPERYRGAQDNPTPIPGEGDPYIARLIALDGYSAPPYASAWKIQTCPQIVLYAYDVDGNQRWTKELTQRFAWPYPTPDGSLRSETSALLRGVRDNVWQIECVSNLKAFDRGIIPPETGFVDLCVVLLDRRSALYAEPIPTLLVLDNASGDTIEEVTLGVTDLTEVDLCVSPYAEDPESDACARVMPAGGLLWDNYRANPAMSGAVGPDGIPWIAVILYLTNRETGETWRRHVSVRFADPIEVDTRDVLEGSGDGSEARIPADQENISWAHLNGVSYYQSAGGLTRSGTFDA